MFTYHKSVSIIWYTLEVFAKCGIAVQCADRHTSHILPWTASFLALYEEQWTLTVLINSQWPRGMTCLDDIPGFTYWPRRCHLQWFIQVSTIATGEVELWKYADCPNFANAHARCNLYWSMNVDWLHQLLKGILKDYKIKWTVCFLNNIDGYISKLYFCLWEPLRVSESCRTRIPGWSNPRVDWTNAVAFRCTWNS